MKIQNKNKLPVSVSIYNPSTPFLGVIHQFNSSFQGLSGFVNNAIANLWNRHSRNDFFTQPSVSSQTNIDEDILESPQKVELSLFGIIFLKSTHLRESSKKFKEMHIMKKMHGFQLIFLHQNLALNVFHELLKYHNKVKLLHILKNKEKGM